MGHLHFTSHEENRELRACEFTPEIFVHSTRSRRLRLQLPKLQHKAKQRLQQSSKGDIVIIAFRGYSGGFWVNAESSMELTVGRHALFNSEIVFGCGMQPVALRCLSSWVRRPSLILRLESFPRLPDATTVPLSLTGKAWVFISLKPSCQVWF